MYKVVSLFAGCGGCDQGITGDFVFNQKRYERLPFELTYAMDIDQKALNTHMLNFRDSIIKCADVCDVESSKFRIVMLLLEGFPASHLVR